MSKSLDARACDLVMPELSMTRRFTYISPNIFSIIREFERPRWDQPDGESKSGLFWSPARGQSTQTFDTRCIVNGRDSGVLSPDDKCLQDAREEHMARLLEGTSPRLVHIRALTIIQTLASALEFLEPVAGELEPQEVVAIGRLLAVNDGSVVDKVMTAVDRNVMPSPPPRPADLQRPSSTGGLQRSASSGFSAVTTPKSFDAKNNSHNLSSPLSVASCTESADTKTAMVLTSTADDAIPAKMLPAVAPLTKLAKMRVHVQRHLNTARSVMFAAVFDFKKRE